VTRSNPRSDAGRGARHAANGSRGRSGPRIGAIAITPVRLVLAIAIVGSLAYLAFALTVRDTSQIPMLASGAAILGICFVVLAGVAFQAIRRAGREGQDRRAFLLAFVGGGSAIVGFVGIAFAIVLALVWGG
jgi:hypothetical protein